MYLTTEEKFSIATEVLQEFLTLYVTLGICNFFWVVKEAYPHRPVPPLPSWCTAGKNLALEHNAHWNRRFIGFRDRPASAIAACDYAFRHVLTYKTGNCEALAYAYVHMLKLHLLTLVYSLQDIKIEILGSKDLDHAFVVLNRPNEVSLNNATTFTTECLIIDPWLRLAFTGDKWRVFMSSCEKLLGWEKYMCPAGFNIKYSSTWL